MSNFVILTDSACDLKPDFLEKLNVKFISLSFVFEGEDKVYKNFDLERAKFYNEMRNGKRPERQNNFTAF